MVAHRWLAPIGIKENNMICKFFKKAKVKTIPDLKLNVEEIRKKSKILFVDDEDVELIALLQNEGWHVEHWKDVTSLQQLESGKYDLIFLDIGGVGKQYSPEDEGFGILKRLKKVNPSVLVVAYSGQSFDIEKSEFWSLSDASLTKSSGAIKAIEIMEDLLKDKYKSLNLWDELKCVLKNYDISEDELTKIENIIADSNNPNQENNLKDKLKSYIDNDSALQAILGIASKIVIILKYASGVK